MRRASSRVAAAAAKPAPVSSTSSSSSSSSSSRSSTLPLDRERRRWEAEPGCLVVGIDEAGRGPLCGSVVAAAFCMLDASQPPVAGVTDSKALDEPTRERLYAELTSRADYAWGVGRCDEREIERINILAAAMKAMDLALEDLTRKLGRRPDFVFIDGPRVPSGIEAAVRAGAIKQGCEAVIGGDAKVYCIAAASIIAKVQRDAEMHSADKTWPQYGFAQHKGYGVAQHMAALAKYGPCPIHRKTFAPIKHMIGADKAVASAGTKREEGSDPASSGADARAGAAAEAAATAAAAGGGKRRRRAVVVAPKI